MMNTQEDESSSKETTTFSDNVSSIPTVAATETGPATAHTPTSTSNESTVQSDVDNARLRLVPSFDYATLTTTTTSGQEQPRPQEGQEGKEGESQAVGGQQSPAPVRPSANVPSHHSEGYTNPLHYHPIARRDDFSSQTLDTATSSDSLSPGLPSRSRMRPLSVNIDLSPVSPSEPPAYAEQYQLQSMTTRPSSLSSTPQQHQQQQQQQQHHRTSSLTTPEPISTTVVATGAGSQLPPSTPIPVSASINISLSAYRRPFLEEDELPDYISLTEANLPFRLPSARSITYRVTLTQGPAGFQAEGHQQQQTPSPEPTQSQTRRASEAGMSTTVQESNNLNIPTDDEAGPSSSGEGANQDGQRRRGGAWTMEYWVGDTILYLCYLMDPNLSATTELVPRSRTTTTRPTGPGPSSNPLTVSLERIVAASNRLRPLAAEADATVSGRRIPDTVVTVDTTEVHSRGTRQAVGAGRGGVNNDDDNENEDMERVPIGHIRGRPPPISRTRYCTARISQHAILDTASMSSRPSRAFSAIRGALAPTFLPRAAVAPTDSQGANGSISTDNAGAEGSSSAQEEAIPTESTPATAEILEQPAAPTTLTTAEDARETVEEPAGESSTPVQAGPLPAVRHVQINDGYPGEEEDAILAHRIARMGLPGGGDWRQGDGQSRAFSTVLTSEFFKVPSFAFVSAEDPQTWLWWSTHHENNLQRCRQEGPNEEVMMWWRTRFDDGAMESRARRKQAKKDKRMGRRPFEHIDIKERWRRFWSLKSSVPYRESMEITMRVRGLYYAWREEPYDGTEAMNDLSTLSSHPPRFFTLVRDDSLVMGQRIKGGPVAEIVIHGDDPLESLASAAAAVSSGEVLNGTPPSFLVGEASTHMTETLDAPPYGPISSIRSGGSSITSNNGNTFMTEVSAATGGPVRSTMASTFIHPIPSGRRSGSSSMRYHLSDPETPAPTIGDGDGDGRASISSDSSSTSSSRSSEQSSSFSPSLRKRSCTIRVLEGINSEVETFALSTGPRLPELFDLFTDQSVPGPSRATFICSIVAFGAVFLVAFITVALTTNINKSDYRT